MNKSRIFHWVLFDLILVSLLIGLVFETIRDGYNWYYAIFAICLILLVNWSIYYDNFVLGRKKE